MRTLIALSPREVESVVAHRRLRASLVYDDVASGIRAKVALDRLLDQLPIDGVCLLDLWEIDLLDSPHLQREAAREAASADFVMLSLRGDQPLGPGVKTWLGLWLGQPDRKRQALALLFDIDHRAAPAAMETALHLYRLAQQDRAVDLFLQFSDAEARPGLRALTPLPRWPVEGFPLPAQAVRRLETARAMSASTEEGS